MTDEQPYEYPYNDAQVHEALENLDRRLKALEPKPVEDEPEVEPEADAPAPEQPPEPVLANPFIIKPAEPVVPVPDEVVA